MRRRTRSASQCLRARPRIDGGGAPREERKRKRRGGRATERGAESCGRKRPRGAPAGAPAEVEDRADYFDGLPDDLVVSVLSKLSSSARRPLDLISAMLTCKRFHGLGHHPLVLSKVSAGCLGVRANTWSDSSHRFLKRCADCGNLEASYMLGMIRFYALENRGSGASLMARAAIGSNPAALYSLSVIQFNGSGGSKNDKDLRAGVALCARAAFLGHVDALSSNSIGSSEKGLREVASVSVIHGPAGDVHDWEFSGWGGEEQEVVLDSLRPAPRLLCGPVPSLEEAKEATSDLKDALEKVNFFTSTNESAIKVPSESTFYEASSVIPSMPRLVVQAFSLLQGSPEAQDVVASLASDKNVWDAVMRNEKVMEFFRTHQSIVLHPESNAATEVPLADGNPRSSTAEATTNSAFEDFVRNIKVILAEMVSNISSFLQELLGTSPGTSSSPSTKTSHNTDLSANFDMGASFVALAVATILVVLLKRG